MYLIDTNVVSELRRSKSRKPDPRVVAWIGSVPVRNTYLSVVSAFELERGILSMGRRDAAKSAMLRKWLEDVLMTVVTRNAADFEPMGVAVLNPWKYLG
jgi:toxin FitB